MSEFKNSCDHCLYDFVNISSTFKGYPTLDADNYFEPFRFCSLNCALYYIVNSEHNLPQRLKNFFAYYEVDPKNVKQAFPRERLLILNGDLDYENFRKNFLCPNTLFFDSNITLNSNFIWISDQSCR